MAKHINDKDKFTNPAPGSKIQLMGQTFTRKEIHKLSIMWMVVPQQFRSKYPKTYKRFASILSMLEQLANKIDNHPDNRK